MLPLQSPLEAYRSDLTRNPNRTDFGRSDTVWLLVAHCLHRLSRAQGEARRSIAENCALAIADLATTVTPDTAEEHEMLVVLERLRGALRSLDEEQSAGIVVSASRTLADHMGEAGALWLMYSAHRSCACRRRRRLPPRELGLAMADQAWVARTLGDLNSADDLYDQVLALGDSTWCHRTRGARAARHRALPRVFAATIRTRARRSGAVSRARAAVGPLGAGERRASGSADRGDHGGRLRYRARARMGGVRARSRQRRSRGRAARSTFRTSAWSRAIRRRRFAVSSRRSFGRRVPVSACRRLAARRSRRLASGTASSLRRSRASPTSR